jgi:hypothetical protein
VQAVQHEGSKTGFVKSFSLHEPRSMRGASLLTAALSYIALSSLPQLQIPLLGLGLPAWPQLCPECIHTMMQAHDRMPKEKPWSRIPHDQAHLLLLCRRVAVNTTHRAERLCPHEWAVRDATLRV